MVLITCLIQKFNDFQVAIKGRTGDNNKFYDVSYQQKKIKKELCDNSLIFITVSVRDIS